MTSSTERKSFITANDGTKLYVQDWGVWGEHIADLTMRGFRCVAPDRRAHGRSEAPSGGYDVDTLADDVGALFEQRDLRDAVRGGSP